MQDIAIKITSLNKDFPTGGFFKKSSIRAVDNLNLAINSGEIFGLLGPNGAGKTTTLNMIVGFFTPTSGEIELFGQRVTPKNIEIRSKIGYLAESPFLPEYLSVNELLNFYARIFGLADNIRKERIEMLLESLGLRDIGAQRIKTLSIGQRRSVSLAGALINDPTILILDEPTVYLDPIILEKVRSIVLKLKQNNKTILISSHILSEVEKLCDRIAIIHRGHLARTANREEFKTAGSLDDIFLSSINPVRNGRTAL